MAAPLSTHSLTWNDAIGREGRRALREAAEEKGIDL